MSIKNYETGIVNLYLWLSCIINNHKRLLLYTLIYINILVWLTGFDNEVSITFALCCVIAFKEYSLKASICFKKQNTFTEPVRIRRFPKMVFLTDLETFENCIFYQRGMVLILKENFPWKPSQNV